MSSSVKIVSICWNLKCSPWHLQVGVYARIPGTRTSTLVSQPVIYDFGFRIILEDALCFVHTPSSYFRWLSGSYPQILSFGFLSPSSIYHYHQCERAIMSIITPIHYFFLTWSWFQPFHGTYSKYHPLTLNCHDLGFKFRVLGFRVLRFVVLECFGK